MDISTILENVLHPPVLFFFLGMFAIAVKSDLSVPSQIGKFLSIYLLFHIGIKGGEEIFHSGFTPIVWKVIGVCMLFSFSVPFLIYKILRIKLDVYNAGAIAGTYGSISAVTFATGMSFLDAAGVGFGGYMIAGMALMESPAIIAGLILIRMHTKSDGVDELASPSAGGLGGVIREAFFNGSVLLLVGSMVIGYASGEAGEKELNPFVDQIFGGMLSLYMLDMGLLAAGRIGELKQSGLFLVGFALAFPLVMNFVGIGTAHLLGLMPGDALLLTILVASASYVAVPAAMRLAVPQANMSLMLPMSLGVTFTFNVTLGIPMYYAIIQSIW